MSAQQRKAAQWDDKRKARFCQTVREGFATADIATRFGLNQASVQYWARKFGIKIPPRAMGTYPHGVKIVMRQGGDDALIEDIRRNGRAA